MAALAMTDPDADRPEVYPGAIGPRVVALSGEEAARRYPITSMAISRWVRSGILPTAGGYGGRKGQPQALIWSSDLERVLEERRGGVTGTEVRLWPLIVQRAYAERGLGEPPVQATGEGLEELREPLRVWGVYKLPSEEQLAALELSNADARAMYAGLAAGFYARGLAPAQLRATVLELCADPARLGILAALITPEARERLRAEVASAPDTALLSVILSAALEQLRGLFAVLPALMPAAAAALGDFSGALAGAGALVYAPGAEPTAQPSDPSDLAGASDPTDPTETA